MAGLRRAWYFAKAIPSGGGYVGTFLAYEVANYVRYLRGRHKLAE